MTDEKPPQAPVLVVPIPEMEQRPSLAVVPSQGPFQQKRLARPTSKRDVPLVRVDHDLHTAIDEATFYLAKHPNVYQRNERLVDVLNGRIREFTIPTLREKLTHQMNFVGRPSKIKPGEDPEKVLIRPKLPSDQVTHGVFTRGTWGARELVGVTDTPLIRPNGSVLQTRGYDPESRYVYEPSIEFPSITENPSRDECHKLLNDILAPISSFPWKTIKNKSSSLSAYLSMLLTLMLVPAIQGPIPGFLITANIRGTGKTKLASIASIIATGRTADTESFPESDEEVRKRITTTLKNASRLTVFDNVTRRVSGDTVDLVLTSRRYKDRKLGVNESIQIENNTVWCWTGNNLEAYGDTVRRLLPVEMVSYDVTPEDKRFPFDPVTDAMEHRAEIVTALLTMIRGWYHAGCPQFDGTTWGSYESWASIVPQILIWLGVSNPLDARKTSRSVKDVFFLQAAALADLWTKVESLLKAEHGITTAQTLRALYPEKGEAVFQHVVELRNQFEGLLEETGRQDVAKALQYRLRSIRGRVLDEAGRTLDSDGMTAGSPRWSVRVRTRETMTS